MKILKCKILEWQCTWLVIFTYSKLTIFTTFIKCLFNVILCEHCFPLALKWLLSVGMLNLAVVRTIYPFPICRAVFIQYFFLSLSIITVYLHFLSRAAHSTHIKSSSLSPDLYLSFIFESLLFTLTSVKLFQSIFIVLLE